MVILNESGSPGTERYHIGAHSQANRGEAAGIEGVWLHPHPRVKIAWAIKGGMVSLFFGLAFGGWAIPAIFMDEISLGGICFLILLIVLAVPFVLSSIWAVLFYDRYSFMIDRKGVNINRGILWKRNVFIPFERIQHVTVTRGPLEILLGLSSIGIFTAGTASVGGGFGPGMNMMAAEGTIPGLKEPEVFKRLIMSRVEEIRGGGVGDVVSAGRDTGGEKMGAAGRPDMDAVEEQRKLLGEMLEELRAIRRLLEEKK
ncbi:MAG: PH domain-containing protein [Thermoplasmata archaeon]|nr:PH domain-containing protein [Thermoplasmata archaeon]